MIPQVLLRGDNVPVYVGRGVVRENERGATIAVCEVAAGIVGESSPDPAAGVVEVVDAVDVYDNAAVAAAASVDGAVVVSAQWVLLPQNEVAAEVHHQSPFQNSSHQFLRSLSASVEDL